MIKLPVMWAHPIIVERERSENWQDGGVPYHDPSLRAELALTGQG